MVTKTPPPPPPPLRGDRNKTETNMPKPKRSGKRPSWSRYVLWAIISAVLAVLVVQFFAGNTTREQVTYSNFLAQVEDGVVSEAKYNNNNGGIDFTTTQGLFRTTGPNPLPDADHDLIAANSKLEFDTPQPNFFASIFPIMLPVMLLIGFFVWMQRRAQGQLGSIMSVGRSKAKTYSTEKPGTTFDDVAGYKGVKQEITEIVEFLKHPAPYAQIGARIPKGVLLVGPPGTGKTLIAKAVAGEAGVPFLSVTGSDFMEMFVGVGASRVRDLFESARKMGKAIIFIDEIDSIGRKRGSGLGGGHDEREQTLNQMLAEMDGFEPTEGIVMMAATNRPDILDPALLRPGRFDRQVVVPLPELEDRKLILAVHLKGKRTHDDLDVELIARATTGMSGADLANLVNEAALFAVRRGRDLINASDFESARDRVILGIERLNVAQNPQHLERTAYHEAGHAICAAVQDNHDPVHKVTIIPTGMALGVTMTLPTEDRHTLDKAEAEARMVMAMGGRVAESMVFDEFSSGAANDLSQATNIARLMVTEWGMSALVGPMSLADDGPLFIGADMMQSKHYSPDTAKLVDEEIRRILNEAEDHCRMLLTKHRKGLDSVARALLEHETISGEEVERLVNLANNGSTHQPNNATPTTAKIARSAVARSADIA